MSKAQARMRVAGMTCEDCALRVAGALRSVGAVGVAADFRRGEATFTLESSADPSRLADAVRDAGYEPGPVEITGPDTRLGVGVPRESSGDGYDLAILGSGSAAFAAAIRARELGARVVMVERGNLGGTCVNVGCVPSKALLRAAETHWLRQHHPFAGISRSDGRADLGALLEQKRSLVEALRREKYEDLVELYGWELHRGTARFADPETLEIDGVPLKANAYLIATGASPAVPPIPGLAEAGYLTSTTALELTELPASMAVIGGNAIGLELGQLFQRLGSQVAIYEVLPRIAPFEEPEISEALREALQREGMQIVPGARITRVEGEPGGAKHVHAVVDGVEDVRTVDAILVATGRRPNTAGLGLEAAGVQIDGRGAVVVDETLRTTNPRVLAAGDVTSAPQFVYVAAHEGTLAADNIVARAGRRLDLTVVPRVTFTSPQVAAVGLTEAQAREQGYEVRTATLPAGAVPRALVNRETAGLFKLVADAETDRLLGAHVFAENAGDVIYAATLAVQFRLSVGDLLGTFVPYLTMAEGLKLAAQTFGRDVRTLSCCAS